MIKKKESLRRWSVSAHRAYRACPRMWWLLYVVHAPQESASDSVRGQVLHAGMAAGYSERARAMGEHFLANDAVSRGDIAVEYAIKRAARNLGMPAWDVDEAIDTAVTALRYLAPHSGDEVLGVEYPMDIQFEGTPITYRADVLYRRGGRLVVRDWKSRSELPRARDLIPDRQLALGALCAARTFKVTEVTVEIASIGSAAAVRAPIDASAARRAGLAVAETARLVAADREFAPAPGAVCATCPVRAHCPVYAEKETPEMAVTHE